MLGPQPGKNGKIDDSDETWVFADEKIWLPPTISKTANGSYDASYIWDIEKTVSETANEQNPDDAASKDVAEGESATFYYGVTLTGAETTTTEPLKMALIASCQDHSDSGK